MTALILPGQLDVPLRDRLRLAYDFTSLRERSRGVSPTAFYGAVGPGSFGMPSGNAGFQLPPGSFSPQRLTIVCRFRRNDFNALENHFLTADSYSISQRSFQFRLSVDTVQLIGFVSGSPLTVGGVFSEAYRDVPLTVGVTHDGTTTTILGLHGSNLATLYSGTGIGSPLDVTGAYPGVGVGWANASTAYDTTRSTTHRYLLAWDAALPLNDLREVMRDPGAAFQGRRILYFNVAGGGGATITGDSGSYTLTGTAATLKAGRKLAADSGTYNLTGTAAALKVGRKLTADSGTYTLTGTAVAFKRGYALGAESGTYTVSGTSVNLKAGRKLTADSGSYALTGTDVTLNYSPAGSYNLTAESGTYTLTGTAATLKVSRKLTADSGTYALTGTAAGLAKGVRLTAESGSYTLTGSNVAFARTYVLTAESGAYTLTGTSAGLTWSGAPVVEVPTNGGPSIYGKPVFREKQFRKEYEEQVKRIEDEKRLARILREDEEITVIMALMAA